MVVVIGKSRFMGHFSAPQAGNVTHIIPSCVLEPLSPSFCCSLSLGLLWREHRIGAGGLFPDFSWSCFQTQLSFLWATLAGDMTSVSHRMERRVYCDRVCDILHVSPSKPPSEGKWSLDSIVPAPAVALNAAIRGKLGIVSEQTAGKSQNVEEGAGKGKLKAAGP